MVYKMLHKKLKFEQLQLDQLKVLIILTPVSGKSFYFPNSQVR
jgi:hypothetical protein